MENYFSSFKREKIKKHNPEYTNLQYLRQKANEVK